MKLMGQTDYPVSVSEVSKSYGDLTVFKGASMSIARGEKVCFVGRNGEGKIYHAQSGLG